MEMKSSNQAFPGLNDNSCLIAVIAAVCCMFLLACVRAPLPLIPPHESKLVDGTYEGAYSSWPNKAVVAVTVQNGSISDVRILSHRASWIGEKAEKDIPLRIIEKQSAEVDAVSGATNSSWVIMNAAQNALEKAYGNRK